MKVNLVTVRVVALLISAVWLVYFFGGQFSFISKIAHEWISTDSFLRNIEQKSTKDKTIFSYYILSYRKDPAALSYALEDAKADDLEIAKSATIYLAELEKPEAIPFLIQFLKSEDDKSKEDINSMLIKLTNQNFSADHKTWSDWRENQNK